MLKENFKNEVLQKVKDQNVNYKLVHSEYFDDLVLYPDNYSENYVWFSLYRFFDVGRIDVLAEDSNGNYYGQYTEDEFLTFVKNFRA